MSGWKALTLAAFCGLLVVVVFWMRALASQSTCEVVRDQVRQNLSAVGQPGTPGYAYYQEHPDELVTARQQSRTLLSKLPC